MMNKSKYYTDDELIRRVWDIEDIRNMMGRRAFYAANELRREELLDFWVTAPEYRNTASFGSNWGYYIGMDAVSNYYVVKHDKDRKAHLESLAAFDPSVEYKDENLGLGCMSIHPVSTPLVELAGDGKTAQGLWYTFGQETVSRPDGTALANWIYHRTAADFVKENGQWRIWHMLVIYDFSNEAGTDVSELPVFYEPGANPLEQEFGNPTIPMLTHDSTYNWWDGYPREPSPYYTFSPEMGYGPEGHPDNKDRRMM